MSPGFFYSLCLAQHALGPGERMLDLRGFELLTFDCYGTLIDWESGIFSALRPVLAGHGKPVPDAKLLELYGECEAEAEAGEGS